MGIAALMDRRGRAPMTGASVVRCHRLMETWANCDSVKRPKVEKVLRSAGVSVAPLGRHR